MRLALLLCAGLCLAGCATKTSQLKAKPAPPLVTASNERHESSRDHWLRRDLEDRAERMFEPKN